MFSVSSHTITRDITFISYRIPVLTKMRRYDGIFVDQDFENHKDYLTKEEFKLLLRMLNVMNKFSLPKAKCETNINCV